ncbi:glycerol channel [Coemansia aciculifera]|uniref:Glycerol channel n=1 Tax=Coemansia aciculifera TaxID=417176 RepID=A0ACC1M485_9FUNG|nr:glycerol channel [Coemansia aciculifera]
MPSSIRNIAAPYWAEFIGTLVLTVVGLGVTAQNLTSAATSKTEGLSSSLGWGLGVTLGIWTSEHVSGGHINPAVTIARALFSGFPASRVVGYIAAQTLGAFTGALLVWINFARALADLPTPETGLNPAVYAFVTANCTGAGLIAETTAAFVFVLAVFAVTDNTSSAKNIAPLAIGLAFSAASLGLSSPLMLAVNPARDFGPRIFAALVYGLGVFGDRSFYFWVPIAAPVVGAAAGAFVYEWLVRRDAEFQHTLEEGQRGGEGGA